MNIFEIIKKYYPPDSRAYYFLVEHGKSVASKAIELAKRIKHLEPDIDFIQEAAILHDIGIFLTNAKKIDCHGDKPYICHGYLGKELLEKEGYPKHALVCERHVGLGLSLEEIIEQKLPIPKRDMIPLTIEEKIICLADKFFSKSNKDLSAEDTLENIRKGASKFSINQVTRLDAFIKLFGLE